MPTNSQEREFGEEMRDSVDEVQVTMSRSALDNAIAWISKNLNPDDVFTDSDLENWAENNGYIKQ